MNTGLFLLNYLELKLKLFAKEKEIMYNENALNKRKVGDYYEFNVYK